MSKKLEQVLECLINEESDRASELLHDVIVEKARSVYQELVNEDDDMDLEDEEVCEEEVVAEAEEDDAFGGDLADDFEDDIEADVEDDSEMMDMEDEFEGEEDEVEDRVEDLEAALADLRAEFDALMDEELDEPHHDAEDFEVDSEMDDEEMMGDEMEESMMEATKLQDQVSSPSNVEGADKKDSPYTKAPSKRLDGADPVDFAGGDEKGMKASQGKEDTPSDNIDEEPTSTPAEKQSDKADEKDSLFSKEVK